MCVPCEAEASKLFFACFAPLPSKLESRTQVCGWSEETCERWRFLMEPVAGVRELPGNETASGRITCLATFRQIDDKWLDVVNGNAFWFLTQHSMHCLVRLRGFAPLPAMLADFRVWKATAADWNHGFIWLHYSWQPWFCISLWVSSFRYSNTRINLNLSHIIVWST